MLLTPQVLLMQVRTWHSVSDPAQSAATLQLTQLPEPSHTEVPPQDVPVDVFA
jgi:hypothetical protein